MKILYELAGADENRRFSPYCLRARMALAHKGIEVESLPWHFTEKEAISFTGQERVPVLIDAENTIQIHGKLQNTWKRNIRIRLH